MSEKIYGCLLRLYPVHFRNAYGDAAMQLFRDRARAEEGFFPRLKLWLDLFADLAVSLPREYRYTEPALSSVQQPLERMPSLYVLERESPRLGPLLVGALLSLIAVAASSIPIMHALMYRPSRAWVTNSRPPAHARWFARNRPVSAADDLEDGAILSTPPAMAAVLAHQPFPQYAALIQAVASNAKPDAAERRRVIDSAIANLKQHYMDPDIARKMAEALSAHETNGDDDVAADAQAFAQLLTRQMRDVSHDTHLEIIYSPSPLPEHREGPSLEALAAYRKAMEQENCTFEKVEILPHNIGYLKLNSFPDPSVCQATAQAAMAKLNHADAIIFDLRDNRGGMPAMVALIAAYLFDHPEYWYNPRENTTRDSWTRSPVPGNELADKPVYVLTSARTWSGAEQFSYDLKMLKRATLVGETTRGGAHAGVFYRLDDHFGMGIPEVRPINPFSTADWEGVGVEPDVKVKAADALTTAIELARRKLRKN